MVHEMRQIKRHQKNITLKMQVWSVRVFNVKVE